MWPRSSGSCKLGTYQPVNLQLARIIEVIDIQQRRP
jgi:hypothetical protein